MRLVPTDLEQMLDALGMEMGKADEREVWALCPDHSDTNPTSFSVNRETGAFYCFACGYRGESLVPLVMDMTKRDMWSAITWMRDHGASLGTRIEQIKKRRTPGARKQARTESGYSVEGEFAVFGPVPKKELDKRGISEESAETYDIRWDGQHYIIPIHDEYGELQGWQKRRKPRPLNYPRGLKKSRYLFGADVFAGKYTILVESPLDVVRLDTLGYTGGVASFGAMVSKVQMQMVRSLAPKLVIALDDDDAGIEMTEKLVAVYGDQLVVYTFNYEGASGKDPGELTQAEVDRGIARAQFVAPRRRALT